MLVENFGRVDGDVRKSIFSSHFVWLYTSSRISETLSYLRLRLSLKTNEWGELVTALNNPISVGGELVGKYMEWATLIQI